MIDADESTELWRQPNFGQYFVLILSKRFNLKMIQFQSRFFFCIFNSYQFIWWKLPSTGFELWTIPLTDHSAKTAFQVAYILGLWWWSSGQRARLLLRRSEFDSRWSLQFFCKIVVEKNENKQKEAGVGPIFKKKVAYILSTNKANSPPKRKFQVDYKRKHTSCSTIRIPRSQAVWPDWDIYWTLGDFLKPLATINLPKSTTLFGNFCKGIKIYHFSNEIIFRQLL